MDDHLLWRFAGPRDAARVDEIARRLGVSPITAGILVERGLAVPEAAAAFLSPNLSGMVAFSGLKGIEAASERLALAVRRRERIVVYGDYDVDGQASVALAVSMLRRLGADVDLYLPSRLEEGYGLNSAAVEDLAGRFDLLLTVDCGVASVEEVALANRLGLDVIVTDHHEPPPVLPEALALVNPKQEGCAYPETELSGCGVIFKVMQAVYERLGEDPEAVCQGLDLVALATVADVVPLTGENRRLVAAGLPRFRFRPGLAALMKVAGVQAEAPTSGQVAFGLAPRLNAAGRLADARAGVALLLAEDEAEAERLAAALDEENLRRRQVEEEILKAAEAEAAGAAAAGARCLVAAGEGWHPGVIGIVASRLVERFNRPAVVLSIEGEEAKGSARSIPGFNMYEALRECRELLSRFGGHEMAAGVSLETRNIGAFRERLEGCAEEWIPAERLRPTLRIDAAVDGARVDFALAEELARLAPFGMGNPAPVLAVLDAQIAGMRRVGAAGDHLRLELEAQGRRLRAIGFGLAGRIEAVARSGANVDAAFVPEVREWNGRRELQLRLKDVRPAPPSVVRVLELPEWKSSASAGGEAEAGPPEGVRAAEGSIRAHDRLAIVEIPSGEALVYDLRTADVSLQAGELRRLAADCDLVLLKAKGLVPPLPAPVVHFDRDIPEAVWNGIQPSCARGRVALWYGEAPATPGELLACCQRAAGRGGRVSVYIAWNRRTVEESLQRLRLSLPGDDELRLIYRMVRQRMKRAGRALPGEELVDDLLQSQAPCNAEGARWALEIFTDLGLVAEDVFEGFGKGFVLLPEPLHKLDLSDSGRYNEGIEMRRRAQDWLSLAATGPVAEWWAAGVRAG